MTSDPAAPDRVVVLHGALAPNAAPDELDVMVEVEAVSQALAALGWQPETVPLSLDLDAARAALVELRPAFVFNLVETIGGRGRWAVLAPALLDDLSTPYTGAPFEAMFSSSGKLLAKRLLQSEGIACPPAWVPGAGRDLPRWSGRWIVKSCWEHASVGIDDASVVPAGRVAVEIARRAADGGLWFAEGYVEGREINVALVDGPDGVEVLPPAEIRFEEYPPGKPRIVNYAAKWDPRSFEYRHAHRHFDFATSDRPLLERVGELARRAWSVLGLAGYARVDLRVDAAGAAWVIDVNANPCLSPDSGFVATAEEAGLHYVGLIDRIVDSATGESRLGQASPSAAAGIRSKR